MTHQWSWWAFSVPFIFFSIMIQLIRSVFRPSYKLVAVRTFLIVAYLALGSGIIYVLVKIAESLTQP